MPIRVIRIRGNARLVTVEALAEENFPPPLQRGQVLSLRTSWAEMNEREVVSVVFQGSKAGGKVERLFGIDGLDETAIDSCELYTQENGNSVNRSITTEECEDMGRIGSAANFVEAIDGKAEPLNTPDQALALMRIIDAVFASSQTGAPVSL